MLCITSRRVHLDRKESSATQKEMSCFSYTLYGRREVRIFCFSFPLLPKTVQTQFWLRCALLTSLLFCFVSYENSYFTVHSRKGKKEPLEINVPKLTKKEYNLQRFGRVFEGCVVSIFLLLCANMNTDLPVINTTRIVKKQTKNWYKNYEQS